MKIAITYPTIPHLKLSGAALRSMQAADERGLQAWQTIEATMQALSDALEAVKADTTAAQLLAACHALIARNTALKAFDALAKRWTPAPGQYRPWITGGAYEHATETLNRYVKLMEERLVVAGIPIPAKATAELPQWLHDLQAMGVE